MGAEGLNSRSKTQASPFSSHGNEAISYYGSVTTVRARPPGRYSSPIVRTLNAVLPELKAWMASRLHIAYPSQHCVVLLARMT